MDIESKDENLKVFRDFAKDIKFIVMDVDGVLTDGKIYQGMEYSDQSFSLERWNGN